MIPKSIVKMCKKFDKIWKELKWTPNDDTIEAEVTLSTSEDIVFAEYLSEKGFYFDDGYADTYSSYWEDGKHKKRALRHITVNIKD